LILEDGARRDAVGMGMGKCGHVLGFVCEERITFSSTAAKA